MDRKRDTAGLIICWNYWILNVIIRAVGLVNSSQISDEGFPSLNSKLNKRDCRGSVRRIQLQHMLEKSRQYFYNQRYSAHSSAAGAGFVNMTERFWTSLRWISSFSHSAILVIRSQCYKSMVPDIFTFFLPSTKVQALLFHLSPRREIIKNLNLTS